MGTMYLVLRRGMSENVPCASQYSDDTGSRVPVRLFADRAAADAHRAELARRAARVLNPLELGLGVADAAPAAGVRRALAALGLHPPTGGRWETDGWAEWWDGVLPTLTDAERAAAWKAFGDVSLFEVAEVEAED